MWFKHSTERTININVTTCSQKNTLLLCNCCKQEKNKNFIMTRKAENLEEMVHILLNNLTTLESVSNFKAACVGHKYVNSDRTEERSIIVFVGQKEHQDIVQNLVPKTLTYKELFCRTDVIQAASPLLSSYSQKINAQNEQLAKELQNMPNVVVGGVAIGDDSGYVFNVTFEGEMKKVNLTWPKIWYLCLYCRE